MRQQFLAVILTSAFATALFAQTTITYQGKLESSGEPFNGTAEMIFELHEADTGDTEIATHGPVNVEVSEGLFQEDLSFGAGAFDGDPRYLQIIIDGTPLAERHPIRPSPMALYAFDGDGGSGETLWELTGSDIHYDDGNVGIGTDSPGAPLQVDGSVITGSDENTAEGENSFASGGSSSPWINTASGDWSFVAGGRRNVASASSAFVGGGADVQATDFFAFAGGGFENRASGNASVVLGGSINEASGSGSVVLGGEGNLASGDRSLAIGGSAKAEHAGTFVWSGSFVGTEFASTDSEQFLIDAEGGVGIGTNSPQEALDVAGRLRVGEFAGASSEWVCRTPEGTLAECSESPGNGEGGSIWDQVDGDAVYTDGNVGVGTTSPQEAFDVAGRIRVGVFAGESSEPVCRTAEGTLAECSGDPGNGGDSIWDQVGDDAVYEQGNVGIGTDSPGVPLEVVGSGHFGFDGNEASGINSFVTGGSLVSGEPEPNRALGGRSAIIGGRDNTAQALHTAIIGGVDNTAEGGSSAILGGRSNTASGLRSAIAGGINNIADGSRSAIAGGEDNTADGDHAFIGGGTENVASGTRSFAAGRRAQANHNGAFVWADNVDAEFSSTGLNQFLIRAEGGVGIGTNMPGAALHVAGSGQFGLDFNEASGSNSFVTGGSLQGANSATGDQSAVVGGRDNIAGEQLSVIAGGLNNSITGTRSFIAGGEGNFLGGETSAVLGGASNFVWGYSSSIAGGGANSIAEDTFLAFIGGGVGNSVDGNQSAITGGEDNTASGENAFVGGGRDNEAAAPRAAVVGGGENVAANQGAFVGGGAENSASGAGSFVGGGAVNFAGSNSSAIVGGLDNAAISGAAFVGGGTNNEASGSRSAVVGGRDNIAAGSNAFIGGGSNNTADAENTFASGTGAQALHANSFVWSGGGSERGVASTAENQFVVAASGAVQFLTDETRSMGVELAPGGSGWSVVSDRHAKTTIEAVDPVEVLNRVVELEVSEYSYKSQDESIRHMGPMAQEFHPLFGLGEDELRVSAMNLAGIALAAIQGLDAERQASEQRLAEVEAENDELRHELAELREQVAGNSRLAEQNAELEDRLAKLEALLLEDRQVAEARQ